MVLASEGYPERATKGCVIDGLAEAAAVSGAHVFHAATAVDAERVVTAGGRVLTIAATGETVDDAAERAYLAASRVRFEGMQMRRDIAHRARSRT